MAEMNQQFTSALNAAEEARNKAVADSQRHAAEMAARAAYHQQLAERATKMAPGPTPPSFTENVAAFARSAGERAYSIGSNIAGVLGAAGAHIYSGVSTGAAFVSAQAQQRLPGAMAAFGMGGFDLTGPESRGISGTYQRAGQSFGGLLYEGGLGSALNSMTGGMFFRDVNQVIGMPQAMVRQRAQEELSMRARSVGNAFTEALPFSSAMGFRFAGIASDTRRDVAQRLSFVTGGDMAGGRGVSATGRVTSDVLSALESSGRAYDKARGYSLSNEEEKSMRTATLNLFDTPELQNITKDSSSERKRKFTQARAVVNKLTDDLRISAEEAAKLTEEIGKVAGPETLGKLTRAANQIIKGGAAGGLSGSQILRVMQQQRGAAFAMGLEGDQATQYATSFMAERGAILAQRRAGTITGAQLYTYGGNNADEAATLLAQANRRIGMQFGMNDPGRAAMFANQGGTGYMNQLAAGQNAGGMMGFLGAQATTAVADPYAALRAQYDPEAKKRSATVGRLAAFQAAKQQSQFTHLFKTGDPEEDRKNQRALSIQAFQESSGITDPVEAARQYDMMAQAEKEFGGPQQAFIYNEMQQVGAYGMDTENAKKTIDRIMESVGGDVDKFAKMSDVQKRRTIDKALSIDIGLTDDEKNSVDKKLGRIIGEENITDEMRKQGQEAALRDKFNIDDLAITGFEVAGGAAAGYAGALAGAKVGAAIGAAFGGVGAAPGAAVGAIVGTAVGVGAAMDQEGDIEQTVQALIAAGVPVEAINAKLAGTGRFVNADGDLRDEDDPDNTDASSWFGTAESAAKGVKELVTEIRDNGGQLSESTVKGMERQRQKERVRGITGSGDVDRYLQDNEELRKKIGVGVTESNTFSADEFGYTEKERKKLEQDKDIMGDLKQAAEIMGDTEFTKQLESDDPNVKKAAVSRLISDKELQKTVVDIRVEREAATTKAIKRDGNTPETAMYVKEA